MLIAEGHAGDGVALFQYAGDSTLFCYEELNEASVNVCRKSI